MRCGAASTHLRGVQEVVTRFGRRAREGFDPGLISRLTPPSPRRWTKARRSMLCVDVNVLAYARPGSARTAASDVSTDCGGGIRSISISEGHVTLVGRKAVSLLPKRIPVASLP